MPTTELDLTYELAVPNGTLTVRIDDAVEKDAHHVGRGRVIDLHPVVVVTGTVKVRGITYTCENTYHWLPNPGELWHHGKLLGTTHWSRQSSSYVGGYCRADTGRKVDYTAKAWDVLEEIERAALNRFAAEHAGWIRVSLRLRLARLARRAAGKAADARAELAKREAEAQAAQAELDAFRL